MKLYYEEPSLKRKEEAIDYINEFYKYNLWHFDGRYDIWYSFSWNLYCI